jgi:hypothetical protein
MTTAPTLQGVVQLLVVQFAAFLAVLLPASALHKLIGRRRAQAVVREFAGVPPRLAPFAIVVVAGTELFASLLLLTSYCAVGGVLAVLISGGYLLLIVRAIARGRRDVDCGCSFGAAHRPLGAYQVARNAAVTGLAVLVAAGSAASATVPVGASQILAAFALFALYLALDQVMALQPLRSGELS